MSLHRIAAALSETNVQLARPETATSRNKSHGFFGTVVTQHAGKADAEDTAHAEFKRVHAHLVANRGLTGTLARNYLDSVHGRHLADHLADNGGDIDKALLKVHGTEHKTLKAFRNIHAATLGGHFGESVDEAEQIAEGTHAIIAVKHSDGYTSNYVHYDGDTLHHVLPKAMPDHEEAAINIEMNDKGFRGIGADGNYEELRHGPSAVRYHKDEEGLYNRAAAAGANHVYIHDGTCWNHIKRVNNGSWQPAHRSGPVDTSIPDHIHLSTTESIIDAYNGLIPEAALDVGGMHPDDKRCMALATLKAAATGVPHHVVVSSNGYRYVTDNPATVDMHVKDGGKHVGTAKPGDRVSGYEESTNPLAKVGAALAEGDPWTMFHGPKKAGEHGVNEPGWEDTAEDTMGVQNLDDRDHKVLGDILRKHGGFMQDHEVSPAGEKVARLRVPKANVGAFQKEWYDHLGSIKHAHLGNYAFVFHESTAASLGESHPAIIAYNRARDAEAEAHARSPEGRAKAKAHNDKILAAARARMAAKPNPVKENGAPSRVVHTAPGIRIHKQTAAWGSTHVITDHDNAPVAHVSGGKLHLARGHVDGSPIVKQAHDAWAAYSAKRESIKVGGTATFEDRRTARPVTGRVVAVAEGIATVAHPDTGNHLRFNIDDLIK